MLAIIMSPAHYHSEFFSIVQNGKQLVLYNIQLHLGLLYLNVIFSVVYGLLKQKSLFYETWLWYSSNEEHICTLYYFWYEYKNKQK